VNIVKIGGGAALQLEAICNDLAQLEGPTLVVAGANALRADLATRLGTEVKTVTSLSGVTSVLTDENAMDLLTMAYAGLRNKQIVSLLQQRGVNAIGLSGLDGALIRARRNSGIKVKRDGKKMLLRDLSGKPVEINTELLHMLLSQNYTPVITVPVLDEQGIAVNTDNDDIVALLAQHLQASRVFQLIEAPGLMVDVNDPQSLVHELSAEGLEAWQARVEGRMRRKIMALTKLYQNDQRPTVHIVDGREPQPLTRALQGQGTVIS
jgi:acetylglutamate/LysW-gamma-L-alpha-aminoadipate kinase